MSLSIFALPSFRSSPIYLSSVNPKYNRPISSGWNVTSVKIFEQKKVCLPADSYGRVSPKQSPPLAQAAPLYAAADLSPALNYHYAAAAQILDFLKLHWWWWWSAQCGRGKGSVRTSSWHSRPSTTCHLLNGSSWHCSLRPTQIEQKNDTKGTFILLKQCSFNMMNDPHTYFMPKMFHNFISNLLIYIFVCAQYPCTCCAISIVRL